MSELQKEFKLAPVLPKPSKGQAKIILAGFSTAYIKPKLYRPGTETADQARGISYLGTPFFSNLIFQETKYKIKDKEYKTPELRLNTILLEVAQSKNIVTTEVQGRNGTIKEYISDGDWEILIRGVLVSENSNAYPRDLMAKLVDITNAPVAISVSSDYLQMFPIHSLVVKNRSFPQREGFLNTQLFELQCLSDEPIELKLNA